MPYLKTTYPRPYLLYEIYEQKIKKSRIDLLSVPTEYQEPPVFVEVPTGLDTAELIQALDRLITQLPTLSEAWLGGQGSSRRRNSYTIYIIAEQQIQTEEDTVEISLTGDEDSPIHVKTPQSLGDEGLINILALLKNHLLNETG
jgi:hypothetical protein